MSLHEFWNGFEKRAGLFSWGKNALKAAPGVAEAAEKVVKPGFMESLKNVAGDAADISGKVRSHIDNADVQKILANAADTTTNIKDTSRLMKYPMAGLSVAALVGTIAGIPAKFQERKAKKEEFKYYQHMNRQFEGK